MAKIHKVEITMVDLVPPVRRTDAIQTFVSQETPIVTITDGDGGVGTGYSYTIGTGGKAVISLLRDTLAPKLIGRDANDIEAIWRDLLFATHATAVGAITSLALAAIDTALWDLRGQKTGLPLTKLAGGAKTSVPLYSTEGGWLHVATKELVADALEMQKRGFHGAKIKIGSPHVATDRARLAAVRQAVGPEFDLMVDANQSFTLSEAIRRAAMLEEFGISWFEEPLPADDVGAHAELARHTSVPIAVGESLYSLAQVKEYLVSGGASVVQVDVARIGGITPWLKVAHLAEAFNVAICPHFLMELHVSLVCAVSNAQTLEYIPQLEAVTKSLLHIENGHAFAPQSPGIGIDWDWDAIATQQVKGTQSTIVEET